MTQPWPEPITDRLPTADDADRYGRVQWLSADGCWHATHWSLIAHSRDPWQHTLCYLAQP